MSSNRPAHRHVENVVKTKEPSNTHVQLRPDPVYWEMALNATKARHRVLPHSPLRSRGVVSRSRFWPQQHRESWVLLEFSRLPQGVPQRLRAYPSRSSGTRKKQALEQRS